MDEETMKTIRIQQPRAAHASGASLAAAAVDCEQPPALRGGGRVVEKLDELGHGRRCVILYVKALDASGREAVGRIRQLRAAIYD